MLYVFLSRFVYWCVGLCTGHFAMVPLNLTYQHCLQHSFFHFIFKFICFYRFFRYELLVKSWWHNFGSVYMLCRPMEVLLNHFRQSFFRNRGLFLRKVFMYTLQMVWIHCLSFCLKEFVSNGSSRRSTKSFQFWVMPTFYIDLF